MSVPRVPLKSRMTANPVRPARYRVGKQLEESEDDEEDDEEYEDADSDEDDGQNKESKAGASAKRPPPKATSFPKQMSVNRKQVDKKQEKLDKYEDDIRKRIEREDRERMEREAGFVTESEESEEEDVGVTTKPPTGEITARPVSATGSESEGDESESSEEDEFSEDESSEDEQPKLLRPVFRKQNNRDQTEEGLFAASNDIADTARRKATADALLQDIGDARAAEKAARNKEWDDDEVGVMNEEEIDDRDGLDPELEHQQWVARELARLKRDRAAMEKQEAEKEEIERRRNLSTPEREAEDREVLGKQKDERANKGKMSFMQKYQHKGAFYLDEGEASGLANRDLMGARYVDQVNNKDALPEYLRRRDDNKIGKKGATRYKDMKTEDTGQFGGWLGGDRRGGDRRDRERTGANASALGEKRRGEDRVDDRPSKKQSILSRY